MSDLAKSVHAWFRLSRHEASEIIQWDSENWRRAANFWGEALHVDVKSAVVLELGAGTGGVSLWFARRGADVVCTEFPRVPVQAIAYHKQQRVGDRVAYLAVDGCDIPFRECFDLVVFKSVLGHLSPDHQTRFLKEVHSALRKGGILLFVDNLEGTRFHRWARRHFSHYGKKWNYLRLREVLAQLKVFERVSYRTFGFSALFVPWEGGRVLVGIIDGMLEQHAPEDWRYILSVAAVK